MDKPMLTIDGKMRFLTSWMALNDNGVVKRCGEIAANGWGEAEAIAGSLVPPQTVDGILYEEIDEGSVQDG